MIVGALIGLVAFVISALVVRHRDRGAARARAEFFARTPRPELEADLRRRRITLRRWWLAIPGVIPAIALIGFGARRHPAAGILDVSDLGLVMVGALVSYVVLVLFAAFVAERRQTQQLAQFLRG